MADLPPPILPAGHRFHSLTMERGFDSPREFNSSFGWDNFSAMAPYIDMVLTGPGALNTHVRAGGIRTALYVDANFCSARSGPGANEYASPDCADWPASAFYVQDGHPERALTVSYNGRILQRVGDPGSSEWRERSVSTFRQLSAHDRFDLIEVDDATTLDELYLGGCWGAGMPIARSYDCLSAPGGAAGAPWDARYSRREWQTGMVALAARSPRPLLFNGLAGYDHHEALPAIAEVVAAAPNAWGAICDMCFYGDGNHWNPYLVTSPILDVRLNGIMRIVAAGKNAVLVNANQPDPAARARALADIVLAYHPDRVWQWANPCGNTSYIHACPEAALTFYAPYKPYPASTAALLDSSGNYVREFAECYDDGHALGPCATVVNPSRTASLPRPALRNSYKHTLVIEGTSLCRCYGDSGSLSESGPALPAAIPPASGYLVFR